MKIVRKFSWIILVSVIVFTLTILSYGVTPISLLAIPPLNSFFIFFETAVHCGRYCIYYEIFLTSTINALIVGAILYFVLKK